MRVVIVGGGYAGLACALDLRKLAPRAELHLVDPGDAHVKQTRLHEALHRPLADLRVPFSELAGRYGFEHHRAALGDDPKAPRYIETLPRRGYRWIGATRSLLLLVAEDGVAPELQLRERRGPQ